MTFIINLLTKSFSILFLLLIFCFSSCANEEESKLSIDVENFLNDLVTIMQTNSINRFSIDWSDFKKQVFMAAEGAQSITQTHAALDLAITLLEDNHSFILMDSGVRLYGERSIRCFPSTISDIAIPENIGYIRVDSYANNSVEENRQFARNIQEQIKIQDHKNINGWIVDLRENSGGNMWPMIAGLGPILGEGTAGYFISPDGIETAWGYQDGSSWVDQNSIVSLVDHYDLINPIPKVAVLQSNIVASSGEAIAISFRGRENTKSFGETTCGLSTANSTFELNGILLYLTTSYFADRNKVIYRTSIEPDVSIDINSAFHEAVKFINQ